MAQGTDRVNAWVDFPWAEWQACRKKPIVVEYTEIPRSIGTVLIATREGYLEAYPDNDYIMRGVDGEVYPIKKDIFDKSYVKGTEQK